METLDYIILDTTTDKTELIVQLSGGGASISIKRRATAKEVVYLLRDLAHSLEKGVEQRNAAQQSVQATKARCICVDFINCNPDPVSNPDCAIHGAGFRS
jgi:hypothetical protein